jgi:hypothetical protein
MATKRKSVKSKTKTKTKTAKPRKNGGDTIALLTATFNDKVKKTSAAVLKEKAPWARVHTSLFGSKDHGKKMVDRLVRAVG